jgi:plastocyanin
VSRVGLAGLVLLACGAEAAPPGVDAAGGAVDGSLDAMELINGCTRATAVDRTGPGADRTIQITSDVYTPRCSRIRVGQSVTWRGSLDEHPLAPGIVRSNMVITQPGSPIMMTSTGISTTVTFTGEGDWGFWCPNHPPDMSGAVFVEP